MASIQIPGLGSVEVPDFATDYTMQQILSVLSSQEAERVGELGNINQNIQKEASILQASLAEQRSMGGDIGAGRRAQQQSNKNSAQTLQQMRKQHKDLVRAADKQTSILPRQTAQILRTAGAMVGGKGIGDALSMMPGGLGQGISLATKVIGEFADSQRRLTDVGFGLGTSILDTTNAMLAFNVPLSELERVAGTHAVTLDYLNDGYTGQIDATEAVIKSVKPGILAFGQLSKNVRSSMAEFGNFGLTVTEVDSYLAEYLESDRKRGITANDSVGNLTENFKNLAAEVSAYANDTGRNRKDLMKAQLENMNRTDASTYSMMLRMKGEDAAADTFEKNLQVITNEMKSRYGDNADDMIDAWITAQTQGRGLEATDAGAEMLAMLGPAAGIFDKMARTGEEIDPAIFGEFDGALRKHVGSWDTQNFALIAKQKESLNMAANMIMHGRDTSKTTRDLWKSQLDAGKAQASSGQTVLKANEAMVTVTTNLQKGFVDVTNQLIGKDGALSGELQKSIKSVQQFSEAIGLLASGEEGSGSAAKDKIQQMLSDNPWQFLFGAGVSAGGGLLTALGVTAATVGSALFGTSVSRTGQQTMANKLASHNVAGGSVVGDEWVSSAGEKSTIKGGKFISEGVEYKIGSDGQPQATQKGLKNIIKNNTRSAKGAGLGGLFSMGIAAVEGFKSYGAENERYANLSKSEQEAQKTEHEQIIENIIKKTFAKGGGGMLGGMLMGGLTGMLTGNPILAMIGTGLGGWAGMEMGDAMTDPDTYAEFAQKMQDESGKHTSLSAEEIKTSYARSIKEKAVADDPTYLKLEAIRKLLADMGGDINVTANAGAATAIAIEKGNAGKPSGTASGPPSSW